MKTSLSILFDEEKLCAMELALKKEQTSVQQYMGKVIEDLYVKIVSEPVREYIEAKAVFRSKRPARAVSGKQTVSAKSSANSAAVTAAASSAAASAPTAADSAAKEARHG